MINMFDIVVVTVDRPAGVIDDYVKGNPGIIVSIEDGDYEVMEYGDRPDCCYWYKPDELRLATPEEKDVMLRQIMLHKTVNPFV